jgi:voltage-gated potassium channel
MVGSGATVSSMHGLRVSVAALLGLVIVGTTGYIVIEGMSVLDAVFMTVITLSTVGFGEVHPLSPLGRSFTIGLIVVGVGSAAYVFSLLASVLIEGRVRELLGRNAMERVIDQLKDHVIVCGYGRFGKVVVDELRANQISVLVIDSSREKVPELERTGLPYLIGSAAADDVMERAGVRRARALVAATSSDPENVFITLSAREKNAAIRIHARAESEGGLRHLKLAGATQALSAYQSGGHRLAAAILRPSVVDFLELAVPGRSEAVLLEEVRVSAGSRLAGRDPTPAGRRHQARRGATGGHPGGRCDHAGRRPAGVGRRSAGARSAGARRATNGVRAAVWSGTAAGARGGRGGDEVVVLPRRLTAAVGAGRLGVRRR